MKKKILIYKWGRSVYYGYDHLNKGKRGDIEAEALVKMIKEYASTVVWYGPDKPKRLPKVNKIVVFLGPENDTYNDPFIQYIKKYPDISIVALTTDHRFMGETLAKYTKELVVLTNFIGPKTTYGNRIFVPCNFVYEACKWAIKHYGVDFSQPINTYTTVIAANQVQGDLSKSRYKQITEYIKSHPKTDFVIVGSWKSPVDWDCLPNVKFINKQMNYKEYMEFLSQYHNMVIFQNELDKQPLDDLLDYKNTFLPAKAFEAYFAVGHIKFYNSDLTEDTVNDFIFNASIKSVIAYIF